MNTKIYIDNENKWIATDKDYRKVLASNKNLEKFRELVKNIRIIRSVEIVAVAYELGLLNKYLPNMPNPRKTLLDSVLWGVKLNGCAVSKEEIDDIIKSEK